MLPASRLLCYLSVYGRRVLYTSSLVVGVVVNGSSFKSQPLPNSELWRFRLTLVCPGVSCGDMAIKVAER